VDLTQALPIAIHLETVTVQEDTRQDFVIDVDGQIVKIGDTLYIRYKEEATDATEEIPVTIKILPDGSIQLIRAGEMRLRLKFTYKERNESQYKAPFGMLFFSTYTHNLHVSLTDKPIAGAVSLLYDLYMAEQKIGEYSLSLTFTV